ncbi:MAG: lipopolysaccharide heptosyltransferase I [Campylobacteraceae bacterium]|nr:lipopolysaccharide heptosyltransferase I [Campylobacteraceae bacterium]
MKIAIIRLSALGDIIQTAIVLEFIKKHYPDAKIDWFCDAKFAGILKNHKFIDNLITLNLKDKKFSESYQILKKQNKNSYDLVIDFQGLIKSAVVARVLSKNTVGFDKNSIRERFATNFYKQKVAVPYGENVIIRYLTLCSKALNFEFSKDEILTKKPIFSFEPAKISNKKRVLISPFASEASKIYIHFDAVINTLKDDDLDIFICWGSESEYEKALELSQKTGAILLDKMNLQEMINFISNCDLTIGNDSGITHLAWAQNRASITLFGNRPSYRNAYTTDINLTLDTGKKIDAMKIDKTDFCINEIEPNLVIKTAKKLLER